MGDKVEKKKGGKKKGKGKERKGKKRAENLVSTYFY